MVLALLNGVGVGGRIELQIAATRLWRSAAMMAQLPRIPGAAQESVLLRGLRRCADWILTEYSA